MHLCHRFLPPLCHDYLTHAANREDIFFARYCHRRSGSWKPHVLLHTPGLVSEQGVPILGTAAQCFHDGCQRASIATPGPCYHTPDVFAVVRVACPNLVAAALRCIVTRDFQTLSNTARPPSYFWEMLTGKSSRHSAAKSYLSRWCVEVTIAGMTLQVDVRHGTAISR